MDYLLREDKTLREKYYHLTLESGFKIIIVPKPMKSMFAMLCCDFGGSDNVYEKDGERFTLPCGTAHFLEHKMFENEDGSDAFLEFDNFGGNANAFTSYENTAYYFSCTDNFFENLEILLRSVSSVHFSDKSIKKERKIIEREITMYEDSPSATVNRNLNKALFRNHPVIDPISGTVDSIKEIDKAVLLRAYGDFYVPSNLTLCICGDVDKARVKELSEHYFGQKKQSRPKTVFDAEPDQVVSSVIESKAAVGTGLYSIGIKCRPFDLESIEGQKRAIALRVAITLIFGRASDFFCNNYETGIVNERFYAGLNVSRNSAYIVVSGSGNDALSVKEKVVAEIERCKKDLFTEEQIKREKKAAFAECLTLFDMGEDIVAALSTNSRCSYDEYDCIEALRNITSEDIKAELLSVDTDNASVSIVKKGIEE